MEMEINSFISLSLKTTLLQEKGYLFTHMTEKMLWIKVLSLQKSWKGKIKLGSARSF